MDDNQLAQFRSNLNLYTPLHDAKEELWRRWNNKALREKVSAYLGDIPDLFKETPHAALWRFVATPNFEMARFLSLASQLELTSVYLENHKDNFCVHNPDKLHLAKMVFAGGNNKLGHHITCHKNIISFNDVKADEFQNIETTWGENFISFHHHILGLSNKNIKLFDMSSWLKGHGWKPEKIYPYVLSLFISHGILLESFILNNINYREEARFTYDVILPAFDKVTQMFGIKPLIVPLFTPEEEGNLYWQSYPEYLKPEVDKLLSNSSCGKIL